MSATSVVRVTPLLGGKEEGGVCSLLEIGGCRILLDCGCTLTTSNEEILAIARKLEKDGGVDCVLLSHADIHHIGALPIMFGSQGLAPVPVVCTLPVAKFTALVLYDLQLNIVMEGTPNNANAEENEMDARRPSFTLDEVDTCLSRTTSLKYSQVCTLPEGGRKRRAADLTPEQEQAEIESENSRKQVSFCAFNSGRTIGGAAWRIRHGATDVLYAIDVNLKKEVVLNGAALDSLPLAPELLIVEGGCAARVSATKRRGAPAKTLKTEAPGDATASTATATTDSELLSNINETLRARGNVLIPCDSCSRVLEVLQVLSRHWVDGRRGLDHLIYLTPMAFNLVELARSQLEWMNNDLCTKFYNGQANPFELPPVKVCTTLREVEKLYPGPKVVLATDTNVQCGMAKELLLRWGGNPLNKVLFLETPDRGTLGAEVMGKVGAPNANVVIRVAQPQRVELEGEELAAFVQEAEARRRAKEEEIQIRLRREELAVLNVQSGAIGGVGQSEDRTDAEEGDNSDSSDMEVDGNTANTDHLDKEAPLKKRKSQGRQKGTGSGHGQAARIAKFAQPLFPLFSTRERTWVEDEYGASVADLNLRLEETGASTRTAGGVSASGIGGAIAVPSRTVGPEAEEQEVEALPFKIMSSRTVVQFTCGFKVLAALSGRADARAVKALVAKVQPARVVVLRGRSEDCDIMAQQIGSSMMAAASLSSGGASSASPVACSFAPANNESVSFTVRTDRVNLLIPSLLLPAAIKELRMGSLSADGGSTSCILSAISGVAQEQAIAANSSSTGSGLRKVRLISSGTESAAEVAAPPAGGDDEEAEVMPDEFGFRTVDDGSGIAQNCLAPLPQNRENVTVSVGEVSFNTLKTALQNAGIATESVTATSRDGSVGTVLVCQQQVMIRRAAENDFTVEGPPVAAYWAVRKVLYSHFAFLQS